MHWKPHHVSYGSNTITQIQRKVGTIENMSVHINQTRHQIFISTIFYLIAVWDRKGVGKNLGYFSMIDKNRHVSLNVVLLLI